MSRRDDHDDRAYRLRILVYSVVFYASVIMPWWIGLLWIFGAV